MIITSFAEYLTGFNSVLHVKKIRHLCLFNGCLCRYSFLLWYALKKYCTHSDTFCILAVTNLCVCVSCRLNDYINRKELKNRALMWDSESLWCFPPLGKLKCLIEEIHQWEVIFEAFGTVITQQYQDVGLRPLINRTHIQCYKSVRESRLCSDFI